MGEDKTQSLKQIVQAALKLPEARRRAYLDQVCPENQPLRAEIEEELQRTIPAQRPPRLSPAATASFPTIKGYQITGRIGEGGMGTVWRAVQTSTNRPVALKLMNTACLGSESARARFTREVELAASLHHPNIASVYDSGVQSGTYFYAMELVDGQPLDKFATEMSLAPRQILGLMRRVCRGVQQAHQRGVIHRDLKPQNILVDREGQPHVLDFGLAKALLNDPKVAMTMDGQVMGTPAFMSPEQAEGKSDQDTRTDVYSLGVILYRLLTGESPHDLRGSCLDVIRRIAREHVRSPQRFKPNLDPEIEAIVLKALARDPEDRYSSAGNFAQDITRFLKGEPIEAKEPTRGYLVSKFVKRNRRLVLGAAALMGGLVVGIVRATWLAVRAHAAEARAHTAELAAMTSAAGEAAQHKLAEENSAKALLKAQEALAAQTRANEALAQAAAAKAEAFRRVAESDALRKQNLRANQDLESATTRATAAQSQANSAQAQAKAMQDRIAAEKARPVPLAKSHVAEGLARQADDFVIAERLVDANTMYWQALDAFNRLGARSTWSDVGISIFLSRFPPALLTLAGHADGISSIAFAPDGRTAVTAGRDFTLRRWDLLLGKELFAGRPTPALAGKDGWLDQVVISPDGRTALVGGHDKNLRLWDLASGKLLRTLFGHTGTVACLAFSRDGNTALSGSADKSIILWHLATGQPLQKYTATDGTVNNVAFAADGKSFLSTHGNKTVRFWDAASGRVLRSFSLDGRQIPGGGISADQHAAVSGDSDKLERLLDLNTGKQIRALAGPFFNGPSPSLRGVAISRDARFALFGGTDNLAKLWDLGTGIQARSFFGHKDYLLSVAFSPEGSLALSGSLDKTCKLWRLNAGKEQRHFLGQAPNTESIAVSQDGRTALSGGQDGALRLWDVCTGRELRVLSSHGGAVTSLAFSPDGRSVISGSGDTTFTLWDLATGQKQRVFSGHRGTVSAVAFLPDGKSAISASHDATLKLWDLKTGQVIRTLTGHAGPVGSLALSPDRHTVVSGGEDKTLRIWDLTSGEELRSLKAHGGPVTTTAIAPNGRNVLSAGADNTLKLWDLVTGQELRSFAVHDAVTALAFSSDSQSAISITHDGTFQIWSLDADMEPRTFSSAAGTASRVAISSDGRAVLIGGEDDTLRIWDFGRIDAWAEFSKSVPQAQTTLARHPEDPAALAQMGNWYAFRGVDNWAVELLERPARVGYLYRR
jgi:WD40 repeat protein/tRNA A-37 threonylcarbamoyl transferase component Bud32